MTTRIDKFKLLPEVMQRLMDNKATEADMVFLRTFTPADIMEYLKMDAGTPSYDTFIERWTSRKGRINHDG